MRETKKTVDNYLIFTIQKKQLKDTDFNGIIVANRNKHGGILFYDNIKRF
jgi:hypothetical protein